MAPGTRIPLPARTTQKGYLLGYRGLDRIQGQLAPILLRRSRAEVLKQLPERTD